MRLTKFVGIDKHIAYFQARDPVTQRLSEKKDLVKFSYYNKAGLTKEEKELIQGYRIEDEGIVIVTSSHNDYSINGQLSIPNVGVSKIIKIFILRDSNNMGGNRFNIDRDKRYVLHIS